MRHRSSARVTSVRTLGQSFPICAALVCGSFVDIAHADVEGADVVAGEVSIAEQGNLTTITASDGAIINYDAFGIAANETIQFIQPHELARVLNRITGPEPTYIDGALLANGQVYLVNPSGVFFGSGAVVDVAGLYAAAGSLDNADFLTGNDHFKLLRGTVENQGLILADDVHLIGSNVSNHGRIESTGGIVAMVAGEDIMLRRHGDRIMVVIDGTEFNPDNGPMGGATAPDLQAQAGVENTGAIDNAGGHVMLGAGDLYSMAIRNTGTINAHGGRIDAIASDGLVHNMGTMSSSVATGTAGDVVVQGPNILNEGTIAADSDAGRGGYVETTSQYYTFLGPDSETTAAGGAGLANGGEVLVHSYDGITTVLDGARVDVSAGSAGGDGGFVELSGGRQLSLNSDDIDARGFEGGEDGTVLLDPRNIRIAEFGGPPAGVLDPDGDGNVTYEFGEPGNLPNNDSVIAASLLEQIMGDIQLEAEGSIFVDYVTNLQFNNDVTFLAGNVISVRAPINGANSLTFLANQNNNGFGWVSINVPLVVNDFIDFSGTHVFLLDDESIGGGILQTGGTQTYTGYVELGENYTLTGSEITFNDGLDTLNTFNVLDPTQGPPPGFTSRSLVIDGDAIFNDPVGLRSALASLEVTGRSTVNGATGYLANAPVIDPLTNTVITDAAQTYTGGLLLNADTTLVSLDAGDISLDGMTDGAHDLLINTAGETRIDGEVGSMEALTRLETDMPGTVVLAGDVNADEQQYNEQAFLDDDVTLTGDTSVEFGQTLEGNGFDVAINSPSTVFGDAVLGVDMLTTDAAGTTIVNGDVSGNDLMFNDQVQLNDDIVMTGTTAIALNGGTNGQGNDLDLITPSTTLAGDFNDLDTLFTDPGGEAFIGANVDANNAIINDAVTLIADSSITGTDMVAFTSTIDGPFALDVTSDGLIALDDEIGGDAPLAALTTNGDATTTLANDVTAEDQTYNTMLALAGDVTFDGDSSVAFNEMVDAGGNDMTIESPLTIVAGDIDDVGTFMTDADGRTELGADITGVVIDIDDAVVLTDDSIVTGSQEVNFDLTIDGFHDLTANSDELVRFGGDVGSMDVLDTLTANADFILFDDEDPISPFQNGPLSVTTQNGIFLNPDGRPDVPTVATIGSRGDLTLNAIDGDVVMGQNEKLTTLGDLEIIAGENTVLGDLSVFGDLDVTAESITFNGREPAPVLLPDGTLSEPDGGTDVVVLGDINFSVTPTIGNGELIFLASSAGAISPTLDIFEQRRRDGLSRSDFTLGGPDGILLDLTAGLSIGFPELALVFDEELQLVDRVLRDPVAFRSMDRLAIYLRDLNQGELLRTTDGTHVYQGAQEQQYLSPAAQRRIVTHRLRRAAVLEAIERHNSMFLQESVDEDTGEVVLVDQGAYIRDRLAVAYAAYRDRSPDTTFYEYLSSEEASAEDADTLLTEARTFVDGLGVFFSTLGVTGLTDTELSDNRRAVLAPLASPELSYEDLDIVIDDGIRAAIEAARAEQERLQASNS
ncbi:MAG: filamentous hemagglutinin N-terminal domain-containing protein [Planctomycetota bacterium]